MMSFPQIVQMVCSDMISSGAVRSSKEFNAELGPLSCVYEVSPNDLKMFIQVKLFEHQCLHKDDDLFVVQMNRYLIQIDRLYIQDQRRLAI